MRNLYGRNFFNKRAPCALFKPENHFPVFKTLLTLEISFLTKCAQYVLHALGSRQLPSISLTMYFTIFLENFSSKKCNIFMVIRMISSCNSSLLNK